MKRRKNSTYYEEIAKLKTLLRCCWLIRGVDKINGGSRVESDGEHTYSMILLALEEAKFVKKIDHYDAVLQAKIYSKMKGDNDLYDEFHGNCAFSDELDKFDL